MYCAYGAEARIILDISLVLKMKSVKRSALVPYLASQMYPLVTDVDRYAEFLPWCGGTEILEESEGFCVARVDIDYRGIKKSFVTENSNTQDKRIEMHLREGPFKHLEGVWTFDPIGIIGSRISLDLEFEFSGIVVERILGAVFDSIATTMVDSFVKRAEATLGES